MIDPKELRIGNLVINDHTKEVVPVTVMLMMVQYENSDGKWIDSNPIPITPEWLERLGFLKTKKIFSYQTSEQFYIDWSKEDGVCLNGIYDDFMSNGDKFEHIKYVHQLQNLYHALTGQELTVKELTPTI